MESEERFVEAVRRGDDAAWTQLVATIGPKVLGYARAQGVPEPEDLLGDVLLSALKGLHRFEGDDEGFRAWLFTIAHARIVDDRRRRSRRPRTVGAEVPERSRDDDLDGLALGPLGPALASLPANQRDVVYLRVIADLSTEDTARILGRRPGAVRTTLHRALRALREVLEVVEVTP